MNYKWTLKGYIHHVLATTNHKILVAFFIWKIALKLMWRAFVHDFSKYSNAESNGFARVIHKLRNTTYGSPEYRELLKVIKPSIEHHYSKNTHHPEYYKKRCSCVKITETNVNPTDSWKVEIDENCVLCKGKGWVIDFKSMTALDRIEMICDWSAAVRRHKDGNLLRSIEQNQERFGYSNDDKEWLKSLALAVQPSLQKLIDNLKSNS